jgi:transcriptional regulator with XRE-family HTH domain
MRLKDMPSQQEILEEDLRDPEFRAEWERTALARAIANKLVAHRVEHGLSQAALGAKLGMKQPAVARLEAGEHNPSLDTLVRVVRVLDIEIVLDLVPPHRRPKLITKAAQTDHAIERVAAEDYGLLIAAG